MEHVYIQNGFLSAGILLLRGLHNNIEDDASLISDTGSALMTGLYYNVIIGGKR